MFRIKFEKTCIANRFCQKGTKGAVSFTKKSYFISFFFLAFILLGMGNYKTILKKINHQKEYNNLGNFTQDASKIAIVWTTSEKNQSILNFYDKNLNFIKTKTLPYGTLSDYMTLPFSYEKSVYFIPGGVPLQNEFEFVLAYHPSTHSCQKYHIGMPGLLQVSVSEDAIFTVNELNFTSYISKFDKKTKQISRISSDTISYDTIYYYDGFLYTTGKENKEKNAKQYLFQIQPDSMKLLWKEEITKYGQGCLFFCGVEDKLYFSLPYDQKEQENNALMAFSFKNSKKKLEKISLSASFPQQIKKMGEYLFISHGDLVGEDQDEGSISIWNLNTKESKVFSLSHPISQMEVDELSNVIYLLGKETLYQYSFDAQKKELFLQKKVKLEKQEEETIYSYIGGFFFLS